MQPGLGLFGSRYDYLSSVLVRTQAKLPQRNSLVDAVGQGDVSTSRYERSSVPNSCAWWDFKHCERRNHLIERVLQVVGIQNLAS